MLADAGGHSDATLQHTEFQKGCGLVLIRERASDGQLHLLVMIRCGAPGKFLLLLVFVFACFCCYLV